MAGPSGCELGDGSDAVVLKLLAFVLPLGVDSFATAAALGTRRPTRRQPWRLSLLFVAFEGGMPLIGLAIGAPLATAMGSTADYVAGGVLVGAAWREWAERLAGIVLAALGVFLVIEHIGQH
jgi:putative Mn2+ efflux pump MntP